MKRRADMQAAWKSFPFFVLTKWAARISESDAVLAKLQVECKGWQMRKILSLSLLGALASAAASIATPLDYWSFNGQNLAPDLGPGSLTATWSGFGLGTETYATGTTENALLGYDAGFSLEYLAVASAFNDHKITIEHLDFTGLTDIRLSYAVTSEHVFEVGENTTISYQINGGSWSTPVEIANPTATWQIEDFSFGHALDNAVNVSIRIEHNAVFEAGTALRFDNLQVQTVPEPMALGLFASALGIFGSIGYFRRRSLSRAG